MDENTARVITEALADMRRSINDSMADLKRSVENVHLSLQTKSREEAIRRHPSSLKSLDRAQSSVILTEVPVRLDWRTPDILAQAAITKQDDGSVHIIIRIEDEDAATVEELVHHMPVEALLVSSVTR